MSKSAQSITKKPPYKPVTKPTKRNKDQNDYFASNALLVSGLLPFISQEERKPVEKWMKKLYTMNKTDEERQTRNDYVWFLLVQLESGVVTLPFIQHPPEGRLKPVAKSVDKIVYEEILEAANKRASYIEDLEISKHGAHKGDGNQVTLFVKPENFLTSQPFPRFGFIVYGSCFSDQKS